MKVLVSRTPEHSSTGHLKLNISSLFTGLSLGFCVLFYTSLFWKKKTVWIALGVCLLSGIYCRFAVRRLRRILNILGEAGLIFAALIYLLVTVGGGQYTPVEGSYTTSVYQAADKVMVIVPHEDDDLNLAAGVIDSYRAGGTTVKVVFFSNGDRYFHDAYRQLEALRSEKALGVPEEDVIFLGYGDQYDTEYGHLYNAPADTVVTSLAGRTRTYGTAESSDYATLVSGNPSEYTRENAVRDMQTLLEQEKPDVIYCVDYDSHPDHRATSLIFEEALGNILKAGSGYQPEVYKGFAYSTGWSSCSDYYQSNVPSTVSRYGDGRMDESNVYLWENRLRLPVRAEDLAYTTRAGAIWDAFAAYGSQKALLHMDNIVNSDKVCWHRRTDSLLYQAAISLDGENVTVLNDFKLADSDDVSTSKHKPFDGCLKMTAGETLQVTLPEKTAVSEIELYDNPSGEDNILEARITLDNGEELLTGALETGGAGSSFFLPSGTEISGFTVEILKTEGENPGLCEIEAYNFAEELPSYIKLTDIEGNFIYNYTPSDSGEIRLQLYGSTLALKEAAADLEDNFTVTLEGSKASAEDRGAAVEVSEISAKDSGTSDYQISGDTLTVPCPKKETRLRISLKTDFSVYDEIILKPCSRLRTLLLSCLKPLDRIVCGFHTYLNYYLSRIEHWYLKVTGRL